LRAVLRSMPAFNAAIRSDAPRCSCLRSSQTWASVARRPVRIGNSFHRGVAAVFRAGRSPTVQAFSGEG
jgi:hypothetical protein